MRANLHPKDLFEEAYCGRTPDFYAGVLSTVIRYGKPGAVADLGAGLGLFAELAQQWGLRVTALEGSQYAVEQARRRCKYLDIREHDLADPLPFEDSSIANAVLNQVIEHIDHSRFDSTLREVYRVLEPGGRIFIWSPSKRNVIEKKEPTHINMMLPSTLRTALKKHEFRIIVEPNSGVWFAPARPRTTRLAGRVLSKLFPADWVFATANAIARK
jgi:SAM-dependent methyltransferase